MDTAANDDNDDVIQVVVVTLQALITFLLEFWNRNALKIALRVEFDFEYIPVCYTKFVYLLSYVEKLKHLFWFEGQDYLLVECSANFVINALLTLK